MKNLKIGDFQTIFGEGGLLSSVQTGYEIRQGQIEMSSRVLSAFENDRHLIVEAGTGTGKTLAYLIPAVANAKSTQKRVMVSTGTKNLQEQLMEKDIPLLQEALESGFRVAYMKGRSNYACIEKIEKAADQPILEGLEDLDRFEEVRQWSYESETGDRSELRHLPENLPFWNRINARSETCLGQKCPKFDACFITRMRERAENADIVVVNHHLFFADLNVRGNEYGKVLPDYNYVVFDEAHLIEDIASEYFGFQVSAYQVDELVRDATRMLVADAVKVRTIKKAAERIASFSSFFWANFTAGRGSDGRFPLFRELFEKRGSNGPVQTPLGENLTHLLDSLKRLESIVALLDEENAEFDNIVRRIQQIRFELEFVCSQSETNFVYWFERRGRGTYVRAAPIDVSGILEEKLFDNVASAVLTSATLSSGGNFNFIKERLGLPEADTFIAPSTFDYASQALIYVPRSMPDPRSPEYLRAVASEAERLIRSSKGNAFVLSTSFSGMNGLFEQISSRVGYPCFLQGSMSRAGLLESFLKTPNAVLFGTSSFWQGVDVRGDKLRLVIIDKLPFAVPSDPLVKARSELIDSQGGRSFFDYSVPNAIISLKQGVGRLIRSTTDTGVIALMDTRLRTKAYGANFLKSLPPAPITAEFARVARFFEISGGGEGIRTEGSSAGS